MKKILLSISMVVVLMAGLLMTTPVKLVLADCVPDGTGGDDVIICDTSTDTGDGGTETDVDTDGVATGTATTADVVVVNEGAAVENCGDVITSDGDLVVFNYGSVYEDCGSDGVDAAGDVFVYNGGDILGGNDGIEASNGIVINDGFIGGDMNFNFDGDGVGIDGIGIVINSDTGYIFSGFEDAVDLGDNSSLVNSGVLDGWSAGAVVGDNSTVINTGAILGFDGAGVEMGDGSTVNNAGDIYGFAGQGVVMYGSGTVDNSGLILGGSEGGFGTIDIYNNSSDDTNNIYNSSTGAIVALGDDMNAIDGDYGSQNVYNDGYIGAVNGLAMNLRGGDDSVTLGAGTVTYFTQCEDISQTLVEHNPAIVDGLMDGGSGIDALTFGLITPDEGAVADLDAYLFSLGGTNTATVNGVDYSYANFELYGINATIYTEGTQKLFDDGVVLAFVSTRIGNGIDVCSGPNGWRVGTIDLTQLANGVMTYSAGNNGWYLNVVSLGGQNYQVYVYDGSGALQHSDFIFDPDLSGFGGGESTTTARGRGGYTEPGRP